MHGMRLVSMSFWMTSESKTLPNWIKWDKSKGKYILKSGGEFRTKEY